MAHASHYTRSMVFVGKMHIHYKGNTMPPEGLSRLIGDFITIGEGPPIHGHHLITLPEEQAQNTLVTAIWFPEDDLDAPGSYVALVYHPSTTRYEFFHNESGWPTWLTAPAEKAAEDVRSRLKNA